MPSPSAKTPRIVSYIDLQAQRLRIDLQAARQFVGSTDIGIVAENAVRRFLRQILPARYSVGVGEAIAPGGESPQRVEQTQPKDVLIYDPYGSAIFGWDGSGINLFPVESIYGVIEVKTSVHSKDDLLKAVDQALEVKKLCRAHRGYQLYGPESPFTGVFVFESKVAGDTLFDTLKSRSPDERADFVLIIEPMDASDPDDSFYFAHWHYSSRGGGLIKFATADETHDERCRIPSNTNKLLTFGETEHALLWFYLFLIEELDSTELPRPNLWQYAAASKQRLGWRANE